MLSAILHTEEINWGGFGHLCWQRFRQQNSSWLLCSCRCFPFHPWTCSLSPLGPGYCPAWPEDIAILLLKSFESSKVCQEAPGKIRVEVLSVNHVQGWVELVCSNCDTARCWNEPVNVLKIYNVLFFSPVNCVSLDMAGLGPPQLHLHVWLGQTLVRGQMASRPKSRSEFPKCCAKMFCTGLESCQHINYTIEELALWLT